jgi:ribonuclease PH
VERERGKIGGRTQEIQRLIGRSLRGVTQLQALGERTVIIDCDVVQADGGTRCAAITGGFVALVEALSRLKAKQVFEQVPVRDYVAAVSVGMVSGRPVLDLNYAEDSNADVDMNLVMTGAGGFVEIQGTAERAPFSSAQLTTLMRLGKSGLDRLFTLQRHALHGLL